MKRRIGQVCKWCKLNWIYGTKWAAKWINNCNVATTRFAFWQQLVRRRNVENTKPCNFGIGAINICKRLMMVLSGPSCPVESPLEREGGWWSKWVYAKSPPGWYWICTLVICTLVTLLRRLKGVSIPDWHFVVNLKAWMEAQNIVGQWNVFFTGYLFVIWKQ